MATTIITSGGGGQAGAAPVIVVNHPGVDGDFKRSTYCCCCCIPLRTDKALLALPYTTVDYSSLGGCCGSGHLTVQTKDITSFEAHSRLCGCCTCACCQRPGAVELRAGRFASGRFMVNHPDVRRAAEALKHFVNLASKDFFDLSTREWKKGKLCSLKTCWTCRTRSTIWRFGPGAAVTVEQSSAHCLCPGCSEEAALAGTRLQHVRAVQSFRPRGPCACRKEPRSTVPGGACCGNKRTCQEGVELQLTDGHTLYAGAQRGASREIADEVHGRQRHPLMPPEVVVRTIKCTDACFGTDVEIILTTSRLLVRRGTMGPCCATFTLGLCQGETQSAVALEEVKMISASAPYPFATSRDLLKDGIGALLFIPFALLMCDFFQALAGLVIGPVMLMGAPIALMKELLCACCRTQELHIQSAAQDRPIRLRPQPDMGLQTTAQVADTLMAQIHELVKAKGEAERAALAGAGKGGTVIKTQTGTLVIGGEQEPAPAPAAASSTAADPGSVAIAVGAEKTAA